MSLYIPLSLKRNSSSSSSILFIITLSLLLLLFISNSHGQKITPRPFPTAATYTAHLITTNKSRLCPDCTFDGKHYYNADKNKQYGHVQWFYGPTNDTSKSSYVNFADIFLGNKQQMYLIQDDGIRNNNNNNNNNNIDDSKASCTLIAPYKNPIFNNSWSEEAIYVGTVFFKNELCRKFDNVYPYFIQGEVYPGSYYESIFSGLPKGFVNEVETFWYDIDFDINIPNDEFFVGVESMDCQAP